MKKIILSLVLISFISTDFLSAQRIDFKNETPEQKEQRMAWWANDRFGMFIHWGIYALPARHEWVMRNERISIEDYRKYFEHFNPDLYNPQAWAAKAREAGMKYVVITTKHHDGFVMWDSNYTDYKVTNTPHGKCLIKPFVEAFRAEGIRVGFYYSLIDWHHPDFTFDTLHPGAPATPEARAEANQSRNWANYQQYMKNQLTELLTHFGQIDLLWMDFSYADRPEGKGYRDWDAEGLIEIARRLQPQILINNRMGMYHADWAWDFDTPEQFMPSRWPEKNGVRVPWETCQTFSGSWGYHRDEQSWKSTRQLIVMLIETVSKGGNLLLNVGPTARGVFDYRAIERLEGIGEWMKFHNRAIYGATQAPDHFITPQNSFLTYNPELNRLYIHVIEWPFQSLILPGMAGKVKYAQLLNDASEIRFRTQGGEVHGHMTERLPEDDLVLMLPVRQPNVAVPVIEVFLK